MSFTEPEAISPLPFGAGVKERSTWVGDAARPQFSGAMPRSLWFHTVICAL